jgi:hypothetical protein
VLQSLSLPASLTVIPADVLRNLKSLTSPTFAPGSKLREIRRSSLGQIAFPSASLSQVDDSDFINSSSEEIRGDETSPHYFARGDFLIRPMTSAIGQIGL